jgi:hypothetical protein
MSTRATPARVGGEVLVGRRALILMLFCAFSLLWSVSASAGQKIRMYEVNSKLQQRKIIIGGAAEKAGCHDLLWGKRVYRFVQIGYAWCSIYSEEACAAGSLVTAIWQDGDYKKYDINDSEPQEKLFPGTKWIVDSGADDIQSWYCEAK